MKFLVFLFLINVGCLQATEWDVEYWPTLRWNNWKYGPYQFATIFEGRLNKDLSKFYYFKMGENFAYQATPCLDLELHYCFINARSRGATAFTHTHRFEAEINPTLPLNNGVNLNWRNRLELLKREDVSKLTYIFRHRFEVQIHLENWGRLVALSSSDEIFYNLTSKKLTQNRFIPMQMTFEIAPENTVDIYFMIRNFFTSNHWYRSFVMGSEFGF